VATTREVLLTRYGRIEVVPPKLVETTVSIKIPSEYILDKVIILDPGIPAFTVHPVLPILAVHPVVG